MALAHADVLANVTGVGRSAEGRPASGIENYMISKEQVALALRRLRHFAFVGITEAWELSLCVSKLRFLDVPPSATPTTKPT